jgi:glycerophosphoryl diester phosphodiesterase
LPTRTSKTTFSQPLVIGHRGASAVAPENTLAAFARALDDGADGIELDVRLSGDRVPVVIHDHTLRRTGQTKGDISEMTWKELAKIDVGTSFNRAHPRLARDEYSDQGVPSLDQTLELFSSGDLPGSSTAAIYIEMKADRAQASAGELGRAVVELINKHELGQRAVVISFDLEAVTQIRKIDPAITTGALFEPKTSPAGIVLKQKMIAAALDSGAEEILFHRLIARPGAVRLAAKNHLRTVVWTVDDPAWMRHARSLGLHAIMTNNPSLFRKRAR